MKVLIAPDKFKGSLSADKVASAISKGIKMFDKNIDCKEFPLADGGEGSLEALKEVLDLNKIEVSVVDSLGRTLVSSYLKKGEEAYVELAYSSGLQLLKTSERNPLLTSTRGTGLEIRHAIERLMMLA